MNYFDPSALIKRFAVEPGSPLVDRLMKTAFVATSKISYAEVYSGADHQWGKDPPQSVVGRTG